MQVKQAVNDMEGLFTCFFLLLFVRDTLVIRKILPL